VTLVTGFLGAGISVVIHILTATRKDNLVAAHYASQRKPEYRFGNQRF
jgi:hypothetical protein